jgi:PAS domain S-box-containing protein
MADGLDLCDALPGLGSHSKPAGWERLFWGVVERSRSPIAVFDERGSYLAVNAATCEFFGVSRDEFEQSQLGHLLTPTERSTLEDEWRELWAKRDLSGVRVFTRADGSHVQLEYAARTAVVDRQRVAVVVIIRQKRAHELARVGEAGELTRREREVVSLVALGLTSPEIADKLCVSEATVRTHVKNSMAKLGARTRAHLVAIALADRHIVALPPALAPVARL